MRKILILGGYGQFGRHIVERLSVIPEIEILVAGRDIKKANALIQQLTEVAKSKLVNSQLSAVSLDLHTEKLSDFFIHTKPFICVNTVGPFQDQDFSIARQCIEHGVSYIDLADARRYVTQFSTLDALARSRNVIAVTGASSVPALSAAIVDACSEQIAHIDFTGQ